MNADIAAGAAIALSKLATITDGQILVGPSGNGAPTAVTMNGDVTISNTGATTIGNAKVTENMLAASLPFDDGDKIDLSAITGVTDSSEGLFLPSNAGTPTGANAEGQITWDSSNDKLYVGTSSGVQEIGSGSGFQPLDSDLTAIAALANTDSNFIVGNGSAWVAENAATARTSLGLGTIATQDSNSVSITGG